MARITIFTPTYNRAHTLERTYRSLCKQTCQDFEWMIIDDGSTDNTHIMVNKWANDNIIPITYIQKENGGLHTCYNVAYLNIDSELCMCVDSDDYLHTSAVERILRHWDQRGSDKYAGILALDFDSKSMKPIGGYFPEGLKECYFLDLYTQKIHLGDTKPIMRTALMREVSPQEGFEGEKHFNPVYTLLQICDQYPLTILNTHICTVEYQVADSMSKSIVKQYFDSPRSFSKLRKLEMALQHNTFKNKIRVCTHYIATSIISRNGRLIQQSPLPWLTLGLLPIGMILYFHLKRRLRNEAL